MKRPVISERMFLYWTDREHPNTCRMTVRMQDAIEVTMMQEALRQTQTRWLPGSGRARKVRIVWTSCPPWQHVMKP